MLQKFHCIVCVLVSPETVVVPIVSSIIGFPILALLVICCLRKRAKMARQYFAHTNILKPPSLNAFPYILSRTGNELGEEIAELAQQDYPSSNQAQVELPDFRVSLDRIVKGPLQIWRLFWKRDPMLSKLRYCFLCTQVCLPQKKLIKTVKFTNFLMFY